MKHSGIHMSPVYDGKLDPVVMSDDDGEVFVWMLPFVKPVNVRRYFPDSDIETYTDAMSVVISHMNVDLSKRNVLITHQFVTGAERSESEEITVGGTDNVDKSVFDGFDYVALGHIHGPQNVGGENIRYCGTPLKYSFSEETHHKSVTVVELKEKGNVEIRTIPLKPVHDMREIRGTYDELMLKKTWEGTATDDYLHVVLTDEDDVPDAMARMRTIYPNIMKIDYDNQRTQASSDVGGAGDIEHKSEIELFNEFFEKQNGQPLSDEQRSFAEEILEGLKEGKA
jgi:exonuclease SbcD